MLAYTHLPLQALLDFGTLRSQSCRVLAQGGVQGGIRSWVAWDDIGVMLYNIKHNRWCGNIGRSHKSNGIFIIADLQACTSGPHMQLPCDRLAVTTKHKVPSQLMLHVK